MNKENIPNYHEVLCCGICKYNLIELLPMDTEAIIQSKCIRYNIDVSTNGVCDNFEFEEENNE